MHPTKTLPEDVRIAEELHLRIFSPALKLAWAAIVLVTVVVEVMPIPLMPPSEFYSYCAAKLICFIALGYIAILAFWRFDALNRGLLLATVSASTIEALQGLLRNGHSFHWYELLVKLALIFLGYALALDARYEGLISIGPIHIRLWSRLGSSSARSGRR